jgi:hypothetical protein
MAPPSLLKALRQVLRPLVRLLLRHQVTFPFLVDFLKTIFVEVAVEESERTGAKTTDSRIHLITGVHRKDVRRIRHLEPPGDDPPPAVSLAGQVIARWTGDDRFVEADGTPRPLARAADGRTPGFDDLVNAVSRQDVHPGSVLNELVRLGVAAEDPDGRVRLLAEAFVPDQDFDDKAYYFGHNVRDHLAAVDRNLAGQLPPLIERSVYYHGLPAEALPEIEKVARTAGMNAIQQVNRRALAQKRPGRRKSGETRRFTFGVYLYEEAEPAPEPRHDS